jgi:predicted dehydrogenase
VRAERETGCFYMMSENCCYWRHVLAIKRMVDLGLFGELTYAECGYVHNCTGLLFRPDGRLTWRGEILGQIIGNAYPTHAIGPVAQWLAINREDRFATLVAMMTDQKSFRAFLTDRFPAGSPQRSAPFRNGDSTTVLIRTERGVVIDLRYDVVSPRPHPSTTYFALQGTKGSYESRWNSIWLAGKSKGGAWEDFDRYQDTYDDALWKAGSSDARGAGHGGADYFVVNAFFDSLVKGLPSPIGAVDAATWSAITPLSGQSIQAGSGPVPFPDFAAP